MRGHSLSLWLNRTQTRLTLLFTDSRQFVLLGYLILAHNTEWDLYSLVNVNNNASSSLCTVVLLSECLINEREGSYHLDDSLGLLGYWGSTTYTRTTTNPQYSKQHNDWFLRKCSPIEKAMQQQHGLMSTCCNQQRTGLNRPYTLCIINSFKFR